MLIRSAKSSKSTYTPYDVERTRKAISYIHYHYKDHISTDQLAIEVSIDKRKLQKVMRAITGLTIHHYIIKTRLDHAMEELDEKFELTIEQIAYRNGFPSSSWFIKHFRGRTGLTPKKYQFQLLNVGKSL